MSARAIDLVIGSQIDPGAVQQLIDEIVRVRLTDATLYVGYCTHCIMPAKYLKGIIWMPIKQLLGGRTLILVDFAISFIVKSQSVALPTK